MSPKILSAAEIRQGFLDFFRSKDHEIVPSSPVVVTDDPTLMFTNAGMNQFKDVFLGTGTRPYSRAADTQKCLRVTGKHNDLEDVGADHYHHTFFEMLGNWSFGDYFKEEAIAWSWELLTKVWGLDPKRLHATVHANETSRDEESYEIWKKYVVDESFISYHGDKDNFWEMGDTGPCGPCTEIHYDLGEEFTSVEDSRPNVDDARFREVWNNVFIQYNRPGKGAAPVPLPSKHVDTGMGFERIVAIIQGKTSHYDTDLFQPTIQWVAERSGVAYDSGEGGMAHRVIADHLRAVSMTLCDGGKLGNTGADYVIRRILRRAVRYGKKLGLDEPFMHEMVPLLVESLGGAFPELVERQERITKAIKAEEEKFALTLDRGLKVFEDEVAKLEASGDKVVPGETVLLLYGTHGFPDDLTALMARERGLTIDHDGFQKALEDEKEETRQRSKAFTADVDANACAEGLPGTRFTGYETLEGAGKVQRVVAIDGADDEVYLALDETPCYAESGGQVADTARLEAEGFRGELVHCTKLGDVFVHRVRVLEGELAEGATVQVRVDPSDRARTASNHTATHLLHEALKQVLGDHVEQKGSLVAPDRLRFDFAHDGSLTPEQIERVEQIVNEQIARDVDLDVNVMSREDADAAGAVALFSEKYGAEVRVVAVPGFSTELCGGTHVPRTGVIQAFKVLSQAPCSDGVRRVNCLAGPALVDLLAERARQLDELARDLGCNPDELQTRVQAMQKEIKKLKKDLQAARKKGASLDPDRLAKEAASIPGRDFQLASGFAEGLTVPDLRDLSDVVLERMGGGVVLLATSNEEGKVHFVCKVDKGLAGAKVHAGKLVKEVAEVAGGRGGGRPEMATAGGTDASKIPDALARAKEVLAG